MRDRYGFHSGMCTLGEVMNMINLAQGLITFCAWHAWFVLLAPYHCQDKVLIKPGERERERERERESHL